MASLRYSNARCLCMMRFQLSLRDAFVLTTVLCMQCALLVVFLRLTIVAQEWVISGLSIITYVAVPLALAVIVSDIKRNLPLLSSVLGFGKLLSLSALLSSKEQALISLVRYDTSIHWLAVWNCALLI